MYMYSWQIKYIINRGVGGRTCSSMLVVVIYTYIKTLLRTYLPACTS